MASVNEWREVLLGQVTSLIVDSEHKTAPKDPEGPHPLIRTTDLGKARADLKGAQRVSAVTHERWTRRAIPSEGDLILAREAPVGGVCSIPAGVNPVLGQRTVLVRPDPSAVDGKFLMYRMAASDLQARMAEMSTGSTVPHLNMADIRHLAIPDVPMLRTQRRIAAVLFAFDQLSDINKRRIELLEDLARSLYREWFVRFRFPGHEGGELVDSELGSIPEGWEVVDLGSTAQWCSGSTPSTKQPEFWGGDVPWISSGSLTSMLLDSSDRNLTQAGIAAKGRTVHRDAVLFVVRGMSLVNEFRVGLAERMLAFGQDCKALVANDGVDPLYLAFTLFDRQEDIQGMVELAGHGTGKLSTDRVKAVQFVLPPVPIQSVFSDAIRPARELMATLEDSNRSARATRDLLLPRLVTGRLDISDVDLGDLLPAEAA